MKRVNINFGYRSKLLDYFEINGDKVVLINKVSEWPVLLGVLIFICRTICREKLQELQNRYN